MLASYFLADIRNSALRPPSRYLLLENLRKFRPWNTPIAHPVARRLTIAALGFLPGIGASGRVTDRYFTSLAGNNTHRGRYLRAVLRELFPQSKYLLINSSRTDSQEPLRPQFEREAYDEQRRLQQQDNAGDEEITEEQLQQEVREFLKSEKAMKAAIHSNSDLNRGNRFDYRNKQVKDEDLQYPFDTKSGNKIGTGENNRTRFSNDYNDNRNDSSRMSGGGMDDGGDFEENRLNERNDRRNPGSSSYSRR